MFRVSEIMFIKQDYYNSLYYVHQPTGKKIMTLF
jgi:hypothetical protein